MRIAFKPSDLEGVGCYRVIFPLRELKEQLGWEIEHFPLRERKLKDGRIGRTFLTQNLPLDAELIILQREMNLAMVEQIEEWQKEGRKVVMDLDDDHLRLPPSNPAWISSHPNPHVRAEAAGMSADLEVARRVFAVNRENIRQISAVCDALTVSTPALADRYRAFNRNVFLLPNALDWEMWNDVPLQYEVQRERPRIGYMGISRWHQDDLAELHGVIAPLLRSRPELQFVAAGDPSIHDLLEIPQDQRVSFGPKVFGEHVEITATMDVGLVPLAETQFNEAKSALKGMEYNACGIPFVASPTTPYKIWVATAGGGLLARRGHDWTRAISKLIDTPALQRELGRSGRKAAETATIQRSSWQWRAAYQEILGGVPSPR